MEKLQRRQPSLGVQASLPSKVAFKHIKQLSNNSKPQSFIPFIFRNKKSQQCENQNFPAPGQYQCKSLFSNKNQRDYLADQFHVVLENTKKIKESVFFKSTANRFNYNQKRSNSAIQHSFRLSEHSPRKQQSQKLKSKIKNKTLTMMNEHRIYPSIPDKSIKFGYNLGELGKLQKITKTDQQLLKEKNDMKDYIKKLKIEQSFEHRYFSSNVSLIRQKNELLIKLKQKTKEDKNKNVQKNKNILTIDKQVKKPFKNLKYNEQKISKILQQKKNLQNKLGPGCYEIKNINQSENMKPERYQFFSSSSQRFPLKKFEEDTEKQNAKDIVKRNQIQGKINDARKFKISRLRQGLKRYQRASHTSQRTSKQVSFPGPADYEPNQKFVKVDVGKVSAFTKSNRFEQLKHEHQQLILKNKGVMIWKKDTEKENLVKNLQNQNKQNYPQIMKKNKGLIQKNKQELEHFQKQNKGNEKIVDYEICSWENRSLSRNDGVRKINNQ